MKKEIDSWIAEDYPKLSALKHPYRSIFAVLAGISILGFLAALGEHSILGGVACAFIFLLAACLSITSTKF
ncbi:MAG TPA: hypothetical protein VK712_02585 [Verrucomicrobiae bacterium]|nr:hypothetical protein [Verrucomicrobiae bacterium]